MLDLVPDGTYYISAPVARGGLAGRLFNLLVSGRALVITSPARSNKLYGLIRRGARGPREGLAAGLAVASGPVGFLSFFLAPSPGLGLLLGASAVLVLGVLAWWFADAPARPGGWLVNARLLSGLDRCIIITDDTAWVGDSECESLEPAPIEWARRVFEAYWPIAEPITPLPPQQALPMHG